MKKLGTVLAALVVAACTHSVEGSSGDKNATESGGMLGDTSNNGGGKQALGNETNGTSPAGGSCSASIEGGSAACNSCLPKSCCNEIVACKKSQECSSLWSCAAQCNNDQGCVNDCMAQHPDGQSAAVSLAQCGQNKCPTECQ